MWSSKPASQPFPSAHAQAIDEERRLRVPRRRSWRTFREKRERNRGELGALRPRVCRPSAHAEWPGTPRHLWNPEIKTPNREGLGVKFWWRNTELNPRPQSEPDGNALALRAWIQRFGRIAHPTLGFLVKQRVHGVPAPSRSTTPEWHSSWFHSPQTPSPRGVALARRFFAKPGVPRCSSSLLPYQPPHD